MTETVGDRLFLVRLAWGDGVRKPESLKSFSARVKRATKQHYDPMTLSLLERMKQTWKLEDVEAFVTVDRLKRTREWLAWGIEPEPAIRPTIRDEAGEDEVQIAGFPKAPQKPRSSGGHRKQA